MAASPLEIRGKHHNLGWLDLSLGHKNGVDPVIPLDNQLLNREDEIMSHCIEVYVYEIALNHLDEFLTIKDQLITETRSIPGLIESATFRSDQQQNLFIDRMKWESSDMAREGLKLFESLPIARRFLSLMAGPPQVGGHFTLVAGR